MSTDLQERQQQERQVERVLADADQAAGGPAEGELAPEIDMDRGKLFARTSFSRMKITWTTDEALAMQKIWAEADRFIDAYFKDALDVLEDLYMHVRKPLADTTTGEVLTLPDGRRRWVEDEHGNPVEDWLSLNDRDREQALYRITTHLFAWEQTAAKLWGDAMFAKGLWEEAFAHAFYGAPRPGKPTVEDRTQHGRRASMDSRYFAIYKSLLSRRADAVVRSMTRIHGILLKDARR